MDNDKNRLQFERESHIDNIDDAIQSDCVLYAVDLPDTLKPDNSQTLKLTIAYIHQLNPLPQKIKKQSKQFMVYEANKYFYSPYKTEKLGTKYTFASDKFKSYTKYDIYIITNEHIII